MFHFSGLCTSTKKTQKKPSPTETGTFPIPVQQLARPVPTFTAFGDLVATTVDLRHRPRFEETLQKWMVVFYGKGTGKYTGPMDLSWDREY